MNSPLVSVVIPCFNCAAYLAAAIDSALAQTYPNVEVIVIDDASSDGSCEIAKSYGDRIVLIRNERNMERSWSRNRGIREARGEYVAFLDADDWLTGDSITTRIRLFETQPELALVYAQVRTTNQIGVPHAHPVLGLIGRPMPDGNRYFALPGESGLIMQNMIPCMAVMARRRVLLETGGFDHTPWLQGVEDYELWLRISESYPIGFLECVVAMYRQHPSQTIADSVQMFRKHIKMIKRHLRRNPAYVQRYGRKRIFEQTTRAIEKKIGYSLWRLHAYCDVAGLALLWAKIDPFCIRPYRYLINASVKSLVRYAGNHDGAS